MKLLLTIITTSAACGFFAGLFVSYSWAWGLAVIWAAWSGVRLFRDINRWDVKEEDLA